MPIDVPQSGGSVSALATDSATLYATCASGLDALLADELDGLGLREVRRAGAGASFGGGLEAGYRACLHSRVANRVLLVLHAGAAASPDALYALVRELDWDAHLDVDGTLAVDLFTAKSAITHSKYGALKVKDAVVDQFRERFGRRPNVDRESPDVRINVYLFRDRARIAIDLSGASLHRRGYREDGGPAPLKENLAAALLLAAGWPALADAGVPFADPLCGSGTLLVEAATIACRRAPGLGRAGDDAVAAGRSASDAAAVGRAGFGFVGWKGHDAATWERLVAEARAAVRPAPGPIAGGDRDAAAVAAARRHLDGAGVGDAVRLERRALGGGRLDGLAGAVPGLILTNPPYGERLAAGASFYADLGTALARDYDGWRCGVFTARAAPLASARLALETRLEVANGGIDCVYAEGRVPSGSRSGSKPARGTGPEPRPDARPVAGPAAGPAPGAVRAIDVEPFANRLRKNVRALRGWRRQAGVNAWRAYDADLPEFAVAIDVYDTEYGGADTERGGRHVVVQEYRAPATVNAAVADDRLAAVVAALPALLETDATRVHLKVRERQSGTSQYERVGGDSTRTGAVRPGGGRADGGARGRYGGTARDASAVAVLAEHGCRWRLNFSDYLDTGLFLDHRNVRRHIAERARGGRFLNLFAYTGAATVAAVVGGARESVSVDLSNRYCRWAEDNLALNGADPDAHRVVRADTLRWLAGDAGTESADGAPFDVILLDPPTFSNSTDTEADWNVQRDHVDAVRACLARLAPGGQLVFSNNFRRFRLDEALAEGRLDGERLSVDERTRWSVGRDFGRSPRIHRVWFIERATIDSDARES